MNPSSWPLFIAYGALVNPWLEEAFWRGWLWRQVNRAEQSMLASTLFHMAADVSILLVIWSTI